MKVIKIENEFHDLDKERIQFIIEGTVPSFANSLRRVILGYVDTLAIEEIVMVENTSPLFDEYIAHRLGLVPLASENLELNSQLDCDVCESVGCDACTVTLTLTQETDSNSEMVVYSKELISNNTFVYPAADEIPILKMGPDQRLILEAQARMGTGREHAKWQPTASLGYQYLPEINIESNMPNKFEAAQACPRDVLEYDEKNDTLNIKNLLKCNLCMECVEKTNGEGIQITGDENKIMFIAEGNGSIMVDNIFPIASDKLKSMAENFKESFQIALENVEKDPMSMKKVSTFERISLNQTDIN